MTIADVYNLGIVNKNTRVFIFDNEGLLVTGGWFNSDILRYVEREISSFTWQDDHKVHFDIK